MHRSARGVSPASERTPLESGARGATVRQLVQYAYEIEPLLQRDPEPEGGPDWIDSDRFDIEARGPADLSFPDSRLMMRSLLAERFTLRVHTETRDLPVYFLVPSRDDRRLGAGLRPSQVDCSAYSAALAATGRGAVAKEAGPQCGVSSVEWGCARSGGGGDPRHADGVTPCAIA